MKKLSDIDGAELARATMDEALNRVHSILFALAPHASYSVTTPDGKPLTSDNIHGSVVGDAVASLTRYAQTGVGIDAPVEEYCISLIPVADGALDDSGEPEPSTELGLVVAAAQARERLSDGYSISTTSLAHLASVTPGFIRQLVAKNELVKVDGEIQAEDAVRFLSARGVPGFGKRA